MNSFVSVANGVNVDQLNQLDDGYEYLVVDVPTARTLLDENEVVRMEEEVAVTYQNKRLASVAGAVAVSVYHHAGFDVAFDSVARLAAASKQQKLIVRRKKFHNL